MIAVWTINHRITILSVAFFSAVVVASLCDAHSYRNKKRKNYYVTLSYFAIAAVVAAAINDHFRQNDSIF